MSQPTCLKCKRFMSRSRICSFCKVDNNALLVTASVNPSTDKSTARGSATTIDVAALGKSGNHLPLSRLPLPDACAPAAAPLQSVTSSDVTTALLDLRSLLAGISTRIASVELKLSGLDDKITTVDGINCKIDSLDARLDGFEKALAQCNAMCTAVDRLAIAVDGISVSQRALTTRFTDLERRCSDLERSMMASSQQVAPVSIRGLEERIKNFEISQRDYELIIFGLPSEGGAQITDILPVLAAGLGLSFSTSEIARTMRIGDRSSPSRPIVVRFISTATRNAWLSAARRKRNLSARDLRETWPSCSINIFERSTAEERRTLAEAKQHAKAYNIMYVWMRRGIVYFRRTADSAPQRYSFPHSFEHGESGVSHATVVSSDCLNARGSRESSPNSAED